MSLSIIDTNRKVFIFACDAFWNILYRKAVIKVKINCFIQQKTNLHFYKQRNKTWTSRRFDSLKHNRRYISVIFLYRCCDQIFIFHHQNLVHQYSVIEVASIFLCNTISVIFNFCLNFLSVTDNWILACLPRHPNKRKINTMSHRELLTSLALYKFILCF